MGNNIVPMVVIALVALLMLAGWVYAFRKAWRRYRRVKDTPTTRIALLRDGFHEVKGKVAMSGDGLRSPMTQTPCVYFRFRVRESRRRGKSNVMVTIVDDVRCADFEVDDGSGRVRVALTSAELLLKPDHKRSSGVLNSAPPELAETLRRDYGASTEGLIFNKTMSYEETVLRHGEELYVLGECRKGTSGQREFGGGGELFIVGDRPESEIQRRYLLSAVAYGTAALLTVAAAVTAAVVLVLGWM